jgi:hypothetical protein
VNPASHGLSNRVLAEQNQPFETLNRAHESFRVQTWATWRNLGDVTPAPAWEATPALSTLRVDNSRKNKIHEAPLSPRRVPTYATQRGFGPSLGPQGGFGLDPSKRRAAYARA